MNTQTNNVSKKKIKIQLISAILAGLGMWIMGGLWHNLILPAVNENNHPHHEGLHITLIAYFLLAYLIALLYSISYARYSHSLSNGIKLGAIVGILWVFPHGLTMAATHETSIIYEIKNTCYHIFEQGVGGLIIYFINQYFSRKHQANHHV